MVSIITAVYNAEDYLRIALDSIIAQTYTDWENICIDDGSTDSSPKILDEYATKDNRIKVIHRKNGGHTSAMNLGMDNASGDFITFLDSDDRFHPRALEKLMTIQHQFKAKIVRFTVEKVFTHDSFIPTLPDTPEIEIVNFQSTKISPTALAWCGRYMLVKSSIASKIRMRGCPNGEDGLYALECYRDAQEVVIANISLLYYLQRPDQLSRTHSLSQYKSILDYWRFASEIVADYPQIKTFKKWLRRDIRCGLCTFPHKWSTNFSKNETSQAKEHYFKLLQHFGTTKNIFGIIERLFYSLTSCLHSTFPVLIFIKIPRTIVAWTSLKLRSNSIGRNLVNHIKMALR